MLFVGTWMDLEIIVLSKVGQREGEILYDIPYMWNVKKKKGYKWTYKTERDSQNEPTVAVENGKRGS